MNISILAAAAIVIALIAGFVFLRHVESKPCYAIERAANSHIRFNNCTGEAHVVVRGATGFEWEVVR